MTRLPRVEACAVCGGDRIAPCRLFQPEPYLECANCGFIFRCDGAEREVNETYLGGSYEQTHGDEYLHELDGLRRAARVRLDYIAPWASSGRLLDVGTATGAFLVEASRRGFDAQGIEPTPGFARAARDRFGVKVAAVDLANFPFDGDPFAAITLWHVLEHLDRPVEQLHRLAAMLDREGIVALEVPNAGGYAAARSGSAWPSLQPDVHVNQFSAQSLATALERAGLRVVDMRTVCITPYLSRSSRLGLHHLVFRAQALRALGVVGSEHPSGYELLRAVAVRA
jgi:2-polyprenyl-3-methyl-5-hydroxy-6-metoxy-1,4-benzoquinol methylase